MPQTQAELIIYFKSHPEEAREPYQSLPKRLGVSSVTLWKVFRDLYPDGKPTHNNSTGYGRTNGRKDKKYAMRQAFKRNGLPIPGETK